MDTIPNYEPETIIKGDTAKWKKSFSNYPASLWDLSYALVGPATINLVWETEVDADGEGFLVTVPAATTAAWTAGEYAFRARVTDGTEVYTVAEGIISIVATNSVASQMTHVKTVLDAIEAVIENRASKDQESYSIQGRSLSRTNITDLLTLRDRYRAEYARLKKEMRIDKGLGGGSKIRVRFKG